MNVLNAHTFKKKKYLVFITTYCGLEDFKNWSHIISNSQNVQIVIIDSGNQEAVKYLEIYLNNKIFCEKVRSGEIVLKEDFLSE